MSSFLISLLVLSVLFAWPLWDLVQYARTSELASHALLVPFISLYLIWTRREATADSPATTQQHNEGSKIKRQGGERTECPTCLSPLPTSSFQLPASIFAIILLAIYAILRMQGVKLAENDRLAILILSFVMGIWTVAARFLPRDTARTYAFPLFFLIFMVPMPSFMVYGLEVFFQHASAEAANIMLWLTGVPMIRDGLRFSLPGISIVVAEECSGIRSSYVLFMTSLLAGYLFLKRPWSRVLLAAFVIPLGILRNGFRIATIGTLCAHISPDMIHSPIHHRGGPIFFVLSLIPFFLVLIWLRRRERPAKNTIPNNHEPRVLNNNVTT